jgi:hypothetical protein
MGPASTRKVAAHIGCNPRVNVQGMETVALARCQRKEPFGRYTSLPSSHDNTSSQLGPPTPTACPRFIYFRYA